MSERLVKQNHTPVLIVGAGFAGLSTALFLGWRGIPCLLVERQDLSRHPRAHGINRRTMEVLRVVEGLERDLFAAARGGPNDWTIAVSETVTGIPSRIINTKAMNDASSASRPQALQRGAGPRGAGAAAPRARARRGCAIFDEPDPNSSNGRTASKPNCETRRRVNASTSSAIISPPETARAAPFGALSGWRWRVRAC